VNLALMWNVELSDQANDNREENAIRQLREAFLKLPGVAPNIGGFKSPTVMDEVLSGVRSAIAIKIYGPRNRRRACAGNRRAGA